MDVMFTLCVLTGLNLLGTILLLVFTTQPKGEALTRQALEMAREAWSAAERSSTTRILREEASAIQEGEGRARLVTQGILAAQKAMRPPVQPHDTAPEAKAPIPAPLVFDEGF